MRHRTLIIAGSIVTVVVAAYFIVPRIPGTFRLSKDGEAWGTGTKEYRYSRVESEPNAPRPLMLRESFVAGELTVSEWFDRTGTPLATTEWDGGNGWWYGLRQDGTIRMRRWFEGGKDTGRVEHFDAAGKPVDSPIDEPAETAEPKGR
jgi:hypothetical protein